MTPANGSGTASLDVSSVLFYVILSGSGIIVLIPLFAVLQFWRFSFLSNLVLRFLFPVILTGIQCIFYGRQFISFDYALLDQLARSLVLVTCLSPSLLLVLYIFPGFIIHCWGYFVREAKVFFNGSALAFFGRLALEAVWVLSSVLSSRLRQSFLG